MITDHNINHDYIKWLSSIQCSYDSLEEKQTA